jgi:hypothetical protein
MGAFFTNVHIKTNEIADKEALVKDLGLKSAYFSKCENGWTSIFPEKTEGQDSKELENVCTNLSKRYSAPTFAFLVHDSDVFMYFLADRGKGKDSYNSCPSFFDDEASDEPTGGESNLILPLCLPGTEDSVLKVLLKENKLSPAIQQEDSEALFAEDIAINLANLLGIPAWRASTGHNYISEGESDDMGTLEEVMDKT